MTAALIDHEDTWARAKELANYMEEDSNSKEDERVAIQGIEEDVTWVRLKQSTSQRFAQQAESKKDIGAKKTEIPPEYSQFKCIFEKKKSERLPEHQPWDHAIELKPDLKEKLKKKKTVTYPLPPKLEPVFVTIAPITFLVTRFTFIISPSRSLHQFHLHHGQPSTALTQLFYSYYLTDALHSTR